SQRGTHHRASPRHDPEAAIVAGEKCEKIMGRCIRNVSVQDVEVDEIWSYIGKKEKRVTLDDDQNLGDCYTFVAIERNTKLVLNLAMGKRDTVTTRIFIDEIGRASCRERV